MDVLVDTNFVLTCVRNKLDFDSVANETFDEEVNWIVPQDVLDELEDLAERKGEKVVDRDSARLGLEILRSLKPEVVEIEGDNPNVDVKIANYVKDTDIVLATMDKGLKARVDNRILSVRGQKGLEIVA